MEDEAIWDLLNKDAAMVLTQSEEHYLREVLRVEPPTLRESEERRRAEEEAKRAQEGEMDAAIYQLIQGTADRLGPGAQPQTAAVKAPVAKAPPRQLPRDPATGERHYKEQQ